MRKIVLASALAGALALAGCATVGGVSTISTATVQADAVSICGWEPVAADIATVIASLVGPAGSAVVVTANSVATAICNSVTAAKATASAKFGAAAAPSLVVVNGVVVHRQQ